MDGYDQAASRYDNQLPPDDDPCSSCSWQERLCAGCPVYEEDGGGSTGTLRRLWEIFSSCAEPDLKSDHYRRSSTQHEPEENRDPSGSENKGTPD